MANTLSCSFTESSDRLQAAFTDASGNYAVANPGGWGSPNHPSNTVTEVEVSVLPPGYSSPVVFTITVAAGTATSYTITDTHGDTGSPVVISQAFPFASGDPFIITAEDLEMGADAELLDGVYKIIYSVTGDDSGAWSATITEYKAVTGAIACCLDTKLGAKNPNCSCSDIGALTAMYVHLYGVQLAIDDGRPTHAQDVIEFLTDYCDNSDCNGC